MLTKGKYTVTVAEHWINIQPDSIWQQDMLVDVIRIRILVFVNWDWEMEKVEQFNWDWEVDCDKDAGDDSDKTDAHVVGNWLEEFLERRVVRV